MSLRMLATKHVITTSPGTTIQDAAAKMREYHVGDLVVIESQGGRIVPIGILTDRDIVLSTVAFGLAPDSVLVEEVMIPTLVSAKIGDGFYHVLNLMKEHGIKRIPLTDAEGRLVGIVSADDIIAALSQDLSDVVKIAGRRNEVEKNRRKKFA